MRPEISIKSAAEKAENGNRVFNAILEKLGIKPLVDQIKGE